MMPNNRILELSGNQLCYKTMKYSILLLTYLEVLGGSAVGDKVLVKSIPNKNKQKSNKSFPYNHKLIMLNNN